MIAESTPRWQRYRALAPLVNADFRRLISSNFLWWHTSRMEMIVLGWLVLELTDSVWQVALVSFCRSAPFLVIGFFTGPIIDRFGRRKIILTMQVIVIGLYALLAGLLATGQIRVWHVALTAVLIGCCWSLDWPSRRSLLPDLVGKARTIDAMLLENFVQNTAGMIGPFLGGLLIASYGALGCYLVMLVVTIVSLVVLLGLTNQVIPRDHMPEKVSAWQLIGDGLRYVRHNQAILGVLAITVIMNGLSFPYLTLLPVFARDILGQGPIGLGILGASTGIGAFAGLFVVNYLRQRFSPGLIFASGSCFLALVLLGFANSTIFELSVALLILGGIGRVCFGTLQSSIILMTASDEMRSRVMGTLVLAIGIGPIGRLQSGALAQSYGAPLSLSITTLLAALAVLFVLWRLPELRRAIGPDDS